MQISAINVNQNQNRTNFKSAIPVTFWEKLGKEYKIVDNVEEIKRMQDILVRRANGTGSSSKGALRERKMVMDLLKSKDRDYSIQYDKYHIPGRLELSKSIAGSFYPAQEKTGWQYGKFNPFVMLMTGLDKEVLKDMGRGIGLEMKKCSPKDLVDKAKERFVDKGKKLISMPTKEELHVIMEKAKNGVYKILKLDMYPSEGPKSPYTIMKYYD